MAARAQKITDRTRELLAAARVNGSHVSIEQVTPAEYAQVKKVLESLGGVWTRKVSALVFPSGVDVAALIASTLDGGAVPLHARAAEGYVRTPNTLADILVRYPYANVGALTRGALVFEPSAGDGSIAAAIVAANPGVEVFALEPNEQRFSALLQVAGRAGGGGVIGARLATLEAYAAERAGKAPRFDRVVMNPPFSVPGNSTLWIDHVYLAWAMVKPGGRLVAVVPASFGYRSDKKHTAIRDLVDAVGGWDELPEDAFKESGTGVRAAVIWMDKPAGDAAQVDTDAAAELGDRDALHDAAGNHIGTARTANGRDLERHEAAIRAHLAEHAAGTAPAHVAAMSAEEAAAMAAFDATFAEQTAAHVDACQRVGVPVAVVDAGPVVYPMDLAKGLVATVTGVDPRGFDFTMTGTLTRDPEHAEHDGRALVRVRMRNRTGADVELYAEESARVTLPDLEPDADRVAVAFERYLPPAGGLQGTYRTGARQVTPAELDALEGDDNVRIIAKVHPLRVTDDAPAPVTAPADVIGVDVDGVRVATVRRVDISAPGGELDPVPAPTRGSGPVVCCGGHRNRCLFGDAHTWQTYMRNGQPVRTRDTDECLRCGGICTGEEAPATPAAFASWGAAAQAHGVTA